MRFLMNSCMWHQNMLHGASLVAQWLSICLPMQGTRVRALVWEDPTCRGATRPVSHNYWACASGACAPQEERPRQWEARAPRWRVAPTCRNWRKPSHRNEDPTQPKINKWINKIKKKSKLKLSSLKKKTCYMCIGVKIGHVLIISQAELWVYGRPLHHSLYFWKWLELPMIVIMKISRI